MEIDFMKEMEANPEFASYRIEGLGENEILSLENKYKEGNSFPKAFREYLVLGGIKGGTGVVDNDFDDVREDCDNDMKACGYTLERPYFVFDNYDSQYSIFFLDEEKEDPDVYLLSPFLAKGNSEPLLKKSLTGTFSNLINEAIYRIKNNLPL